MTSDRAVRLSKTLARVLRHAPHEFGLDLAPGGWVPVDALLSALRERGTRLDLDGLRALVRDDDKERYTLDETRGLIRANQGHSVPVDLQLEAAEPPDLLYHGTPGRSVEVILQGGLSRMRRHHVHLSADVPTAVRVGTRRGEAVVLVVAARAMREAGFVFFRSSNGVWLVDEVPARFLSVLGAT